MIFRTRSAVGGPSGARRRPMRAGVLAAACVVALNFIVVPLVVAQAITSGSPLDGVAAVVGGETILRSEVAAAVLMKQAEFPGLPDSALRDLVIKAMIDQKLLYAKAVEDSVQVTDEEVNQQIDYQLQQIVQSYGSEKRAEEVYGKSLSQIKRDYRDLVRKNILGERWRQQKLADIPRVTRGEVQNFFAQYHDTLASQKVPVQYDVAVITLIIKPSAAAKDSALAIATRILDSLQRGISFEVLAKRWSDDPGSAVSGGDLGFQKRGIFVKEFDQSAFGLKEGETSGLVETMFGYHIIRLIERRGEEVRVRHILIKIPRTSADETTANDSLLNLRSRINRGESFSAIATKYSEDPDSRPFGGDLGPLAAAALPPGLVEQLRTLKPGEISAPIKSTLPTGEASYKMYLLKRIIPEHTPTLETDYKQIERIAGQFAQQQRYEALMVDVRKQVYWEILQ